MYVSQLGVSEWISVGHFWSHAPVRIGSGDIRPFPQDSLTLVAFWRVFSVHQSHCRKHNSTWGKP